jgi:hypothetical protein
MQRKRCIKKILNPRKIKNRGKTYREYLEVQRLL